MEHPARRRKNSFEVETGKGACLTSDNVDDDDGIWSFWHLVLWSTTTPRNVVLNVIIGNKNHGYYSDKLVFVIQQEDKPKAPTNKEITRTNQLDIERVLSLTLVKEGANQKLKLLRWLKSNYFWGFWAPQKGPSAGPWHEDSSVTSSSGTRIPHAHLIYIHRRIWNLITMMLKAEHLMKISAANRTT